MLRRRGARRAAEVHQLEERLHERIVGQKRAVIALSDAIRRSRSGLSDPRRPIGSFIFSGPTGVGKTELARALAEFLFADRDALIRVDMSEYMTPGSSQRLLAVGRGVTSLAEQVRQQPLTVVLLDENYDIRPSLGSAKGWGDRAA